MIFETHAHYDDERFDCDRDELLRSMALNNVGPIVNVMAEMPRLDEIISLIEKYPFMYGAFGVHPSDIKELDMTDMDRLSAALKHEKCVAVGEIGLDYYWDKDNPKQQRFWFEHMIGMAGEAKLPVIVHSRDAAEDTLDIAKETDLGDIGAVIHCFSYSKEVAKQFLDMGCHIGIGGVVTFKNARKLVETVEVMPLDRILLETDCPYMAPEPHRGERNNSIYIDHVAQKIADIKGITKEEVIDITFDNAKRFFGI